MADLTVSFCFAKGFSLAGIATHQMGYFWGFGVESIGVGGFDGKISFENFDSLKSRGGVR